MTTDETQEDSTVTASMANENQPSPDEMMAAADKEFAESLNALFTDLVTLGGDHDPHTCSKIPELRSGEALDSCHGLRPEILSDHDDGCAIDPEAE